MNLNLGGVSQPPAQQNPSAQLSLNIANKPVEMPKEGIRVQEQFIQEKNEKSELMIAPRGGRK